MIECYPTFEKIVPSLILIQINYRLSSFGCTSGIAMKCSSEPISEESQSAKVQLFRTMFSLVDAFHKIFPSFYDGPCSLKVYGSKLATALFTAVYWALKITVLICMEIAPKVDQTITVTFYIFSVIFFLFRSAFQKKKKKRFLKPSLCIRR